MKHLTEVLITPKNRDKFKREKRLCDLKKGDHIYIKFYSNKVAVGTVTKVGKEYIEYTESGEIFDIYFPDHPKKPKLYVLYPVAGSFEEEYYIDGNQYGYNIYTTSEELLKDKMEEYKR